MAAHREHDADGTDPLAGPLSRWRERAGVRHLRLANLAGPSLVTMVAEMLRVDPAAAAGLAELIQLHTAGNPYETVELLNALRREGVLTPTDTGWRWDAATARGRLDRPEAGGLLATPVAAMPARSRHLIEAMACLGGRATVNALQTATGEPAGGMEGLLAPALDEGVLVVEPGADEAVRFRHDRIQEAILRGLTPHRRRHLQLTMARRLAGTPELSELAAEQYLPVIDAIDDPAERQQVVELLQRAAADARSAADHALVSTLLGAALTLSARTGPTRSSRCTPGVRPRCTASGVWRRRTRSIAPSRTCVPPRCSARTRARCRCTACPPEPVRRRGRTGRRVAARARDRRPGGPVRR